MVQQPLPDGRPRPSLTDEPLSVALPVLLARRGLTLGALGGLLRAEGIAISRTRLHQLATGTGAPPTPEQLERLSSVLGVSPSHFAEYRLWRVRALLDPGVVGFDRAMANLARMRGRRGHDLDVGGPVGAPRYPPRVSSPAEERP
jgi:transcriptional regulator with XRE-family HTH domain